MSYKKHYKLVSPNARMNLYKSESDGDKVPGSSKKSKSVLPQVYTGMMGRTARYVQYDLMESDPEVSSSLDILSDFCTQNNDENDGMPFDVKYEDEVSDTTVETIETKLKDWVKLNHFEARIFDIVRKTLKFGDQFFVRDPETLELLPVDTYNVERVIVDETKGKRPEQYEIKDLQINLQASIATNPIQATTTYTIPGTASATNMSGGSGISGGGHVGMPNGATSGSRFMQQMQTFTVNAEHVVHLSMNTGLDVNWPFGTSILENVYKVYKQKELLEDAIIIYRIQRAPERRIFKIDVGDLPHPKAIQFVERMKNELHQKRIPAKNSGNTFTLMDTAYDPQCLDLSTKIPLLDGRTLELSKLISEHNEGKQNWVYSINPDSGEIVPGIISAAAVTRKDAKVLKITLDNGEELICTPDHKIPVQGKGFVEAQDLTENDSLFGFEKLRLSHQAKESKISKIEYLDQTMDVGTITVDGDHKYHDYHTFAIEGGIFVKNSMLEDFYFPVTADGRGSDVTTLPGGMCLDLNTEVKLLDGRNLSLKNIIKELKEDKELWTYSCHPTTGEIVPGKITWAGVTRKDAKVLKITLDNNESIICTPDHKFPIKDKGFVEAQNLSEGQSLIPIYEREKPIKGKIGSCYTQFFNNTEKKWEFTHRMVARYFKETLLENTLLHDVRFINEDRKTIHHKDFDRYNNSPSNLVWMNNSDHIVYHGSLGFTKEEQEKGCIAAKEHLAWIKENDTKSFVNHKIVKIEYLEETMDTGTLTVDGNEEFHDYHTFALSAGVFTKNSLGEINDLVFFSNKLIRGLKIPSSYLPFGPEDGGHGNNDGRPGQVLVQEIRFAKYCQRIQSILIKALDKEFKYYLIQKGYSIDPRDFNLRFNKPMNFSDWTFVEMMGSRVGLFAQLNDIPFLAKRMLLEEFMGWDAEKIAKNARLWKEENPSKLSGLADDKFTDERFEGAPGLKSVNVAPELEDDIDTEEGESEEGDMDLDNDLGMNLGAEDLGEI